MNKKSLKYLSVIVIFFLGFFAVNAIELNNINTNYSVGDTLGVGWFNNLKSRIKDIYGNGLNVGIGTSTPTQKLDVVGNVNSNGYCINGVCKNSWDPNSPWNISGDNIYFTGGSVGIGVQNPAGFLNLEERDAGPNSAGDGASLVIGDINGAHLELDNNEIHAMNGNAASTLFLNHEGGNTAIGGNVNISGHINKVCVTRSDAAGNPWASCPPTHPFRVIGFAGGSVNWASPEYNVWHPHPTANTVWICCK